MNVLARLDFEIGYYGVIVQNVIALSAGAVEYTDCTAAEE